MITKPILLAILAVALFAVMNVLIKAMSFYYETPQVAFVRYVAAGVAILIWITRVRPGWPSIEAVEGNVLRGVLALATSLSFFYSLALLPLADAIALSFLAPIFTMVFAIALLGERPGWRGFLSVALGFLGMIVMLSEQLGTNERPIWGIAASIFAAVTYALSMILLRSRARRDSPELIVFFQSWIPALLIAPVAGTVWQPMTIEDVVPLLAMGIIGVAGHLAMTRAFALAPASTLAPIEYSALIYAAVFGVVMFGETPSWRTFAGAALIICGALLTGRR